MEGSVAEPEPLGAEIFWLEPGGVDLSKYFSILFQLVGADEKNFAKSGMVQKPGANQKRLGFSTLVVGTVQYTVSYPPTWCPPSRGWWQGPLWRRCRPWPPPAAARSPAREDFFKIKCAVEEPKFRPLFWSVQSKDQQNLLIR